MSLVFVSVKCFVFVCICFPFFVCLVFLLFLCVLLFVSYCYISFLSSFFFFPLCECFLSYFAVVCYLLISCVKMRSFNLLCVLDLLCACHKSYKLLRVFIGKLRWNPQNSLWGCCWFSTGDNDDDSQFVECPNILGKAMLMTLSVSLRVASCCGYFNQSHSHWMTAHQS